VAMAAVVTVARGADKEEAFEKKKSTLELESSMTLGKM